MYEVILIFLTLKITGNWRTIQRKDAVAAYGDPAFSTGFDYLFSQFRGYEQLRTYLLNEMDVLLLVGHELPIEEMKFTGSQNDFVGLVNLFKETGKLVDPKTGLPATEEQIASLLKEVFQADWGTSEDFQTLKAIHGDSNLSEDLKEVIKGLRKKWEQEEGDQVYGIDNKDKPE